MDQARALDRSKRARGPLYGVPILINTSFNVSGQPIVRTGLTMLLDAQPDIEVVGAAADGREAVRLALQLRPDVGLFDIRMPLMNGIEVVKNLTKDFPKVKKLVLSMHDSEEYVVESIESGADGYLLKGSSKAEFLKALHSIAAGGKYFSGDISEIIIDNFVRGKSKPIQKPLSTPEEISILTNREKQILELILDGKGNNEIAEVYDALLAQNARLLQGVGRTPKPPATGTGCSGCWRGPCRRRGRGCC